MYNGLINVYREPGYTSFDVVAKLRGILKQKKIGHTGTLDPIATGNKIRELRESIKMSQLMLGNKLGLTQAYIGKIERGENVARIEINIQMAKFFQVSLNYLLTNAGDDFRRDISVSIKILESTLTSF